MSVTVVYRNKLECLQLLFTYLQVRLEPIRVEPITGLHSNGRLLAFPSNLRLGWKGMAVANTVAYYNTATIGNVTQLKGNKLAAVLRHS